MQNTGTVYLLHFSRPYKHARHYLGFCERGNLFDRLKRHAAGNGARLMEIVKTNGIDFALVRTWKNQTRHFERNLKNRKNAPKLCPICQAHKTRKGE